MSKRPANTEHKEDFKRAESEDRPRVRHPDPFYLELAEEVAPRERARLLDRRNQDNIEHPFLVEDSGSDSEVEITVVRLCVPRAAVEPLEIEPPLVDPTSAPSPLVDPTSATVSPLVDPTSAPVSPLVDPTFYNDDDDGNSGWVEAPPHGTEGLYLSRPSDPESSNEPESSYEPYVPSDFYEGASAYLPE